MPDEQEQPPAREVVKRKREWNPEWIKNRSHRVPSNVVAQRLTEIESALGMGYTERQLCRKFAAEWGLTRKSVQTNYISRAKRNIRERAGLTRPEAKGASLDFWHRRLTRYLMQERQQEQVLATEQKRETELQAEFDAAETEEARAALTEELRRVGVRISRAMDELASLRAAIHGMRDRADRILGTIAPLKIAETDANGDDRPRTPDEIRVALVNLGVPVPALPMEQALPVEFKQVTGVEMPE